MTLFIIYTFIVLSSFIYIRWDKSTSREISTIVILSGKSKYITDFRLRWGINYIRKHNYKGKVYVCGKNFGSYMQDYISDRVKDVTIEIVQSTSTMEDAVLTRAVVKGNDSVILLITSLSHQRRAFNTFSKVFNPDQITNCPTWYEVWSWYSPLLPTGWVATLLNVLKNFTYNR